MLDIKYIRDHIDAVKAGVVKKRMDVDIDRLLELDDQRKSLQHTMDQLKSDQKAAGQRRDIDTAKKLKSDIQSLQSQYDEVMAAYQALMLQVPQVPHESIPDGADDSDNVQIKQRGDQTSFDFEPLPHTDLMLRHEMVDFTRGAKVHGFRGYYLIGDGARLSWAIWNYANTFFGSKGFVPMLPPAIVREPNLYGT
jgi:seryl-tRNA synthetase